MRALRSLFILIALILASSFSVRAQDASRRETLLGISGRQKPAPPLHAPQGWQDHIANGKLVLSLDDAIRLALANNTDIQLDRSQIEFAQNNLSRVHARFDPSLTSSFADQRTKSPTSTQLQGASILNTLNQTTQIGYSQTFLTGTNFQTFFNANKFSTNSSFNFLNPSLATALQFTVTQPLLRNRGLFPNRAPILIAQRNLKQARATFQAEVSGVILQTAGNYWNVVLARENLRYSGSHWRGLRRVTITTRRP